MTAPIQGRVGRGVRRPLEISKIPGRGLRTLSGGRLLRQAYLPTPTRGCATRWCRSRVPTTRSANACTAGALSCLPLAAWDIASARVFFTAALAVHGAPGDGASVRVGASSGSLPTPATRSPVLWARCPRPPEHIWASALGPAIQ